jgi:cell wall-associated NlpC family hydrolase
LFYITGCSADKNAGSLGESQGNTGISENEEQKGLSLENCGVIIDTVVDVFKDSSIQTDRITQAIFNQPAEIIEEKDAWTKVKVSDGHTGWIKSKYIDRDISSLNIKGCKYRVVVTSKSSKVLSEPKYGVVLREVVMGTEFYPAESVDGWYRIALPGNKTGWLNESGTIQIPVKKHILKTTADDFVATAIKFKGAIYLSGGVSAWGGIDSSGLTYISSRINGIDLPRSISQQYKSGKAVDKNTGNLIRGDLIFFSTDEDLKDISIVGIYTGNNEFLYASKSMGTVTVSTITDSFFQKRMVGVRRVF